MAKGKGLKPKTQVVTAPKKEKGPKPDYKIQKAGKEEMKDIYAKDIDTAKRRLNTAAAKDKWIYHLEYKTLVKSKHNQPK